MSLVLDADRLRKTALPEVRESIADKVSSYYAGGLFDVNENRLAGDVIRLLADDAETRVRRVLSNNLQWNLDVPRDIAFSLANDITEVAVPMLKHSKVLTDDDLINIVLDAKDVRCLVAIAERDIVTRPLTRALINTNIREVVLSLLVNTGVDFAEDDYKSILTNFGRDQKVLYLMVDLGGLPLSIVQKIYVLVPDDLKEQLLSSYNISEAELLNVDIAAKSNIASIASVGEGELLKTSQIVESLRNEGQLTSSVMLKSLCDCDLMFFEVAIANLANIERVNIVLLIKNNRERDFKELCHRAKMPNDLVRPMFVLLGGLVKINEEYKNSLSRSECQQRLVEYLVNRGYDKSVPMISYLITLMT